MIMAKMISNQTGQSRLLNKPQPFEVAVAAKPIAMMGIAMRTTSVSIMIKPKFAVHRLSRVWTRARRGNKASKRHIRPMTPRNVKRRIAVSCSIKKFTVPSCRDLLNFGKRPLKRWCGRPELNLR